MVLLLKSGILTTAAVNINTTELAKKLNIDPGRKMLKKPFTEYWRLCMSRVAPALRPNLTLSEDFISVNISVLVPSEILMILKDFSFYCSYKKYRGLIPWIRFLQNLYFELLYERRKLSRAPFSGLRDALLQVSERREPESHEDILRELEGELEERLIREQAMNSFGFFINSSVMSSSNIISVTNSSTAPLTTAEIGDQESGF